MNDRLIIMQFNKLILSVLIIITSSLAFGASSSDGVFSEQFLENDIRSHAKIGIWKSNFLPRLDDVFEAQGKTAREAISFIANHKGSTVEKFIQNLYNERISAGSLNEPIQTKFFRTFVEADKTKLGISQMVYEVTLACYIFRKGSALRADSCRAFPKLLAVASKILNNNIPARGKSYDSEGRTSSEVNVNRGLVAVRALTPLFMAYRIAVDLNMVFDSGFKRVFLHSSKSALAESNRSLKDFFAVKNRNYTFFQDSAEVSYRDFVSSYNVESAIENCNSKRADFNQKTIAYNIGQPSEKHRKLSKIQKCASNHVVVMFFGRLMNRILHGYSLGNSHKEFEKIVQRAVLRKDDVYIMSDSYRTYEKKGISYSLLQLRFIAYAQFLMQNETRQSLKSIYNSKLMKAMDFMAKATAADSPYFRSGYFRVEEKAKYVEFSTAEKESAWHRNYGFFALPFGLYCDSTEAKASYNRLCVARTGEHLNHTYPLGEGKLREDMYLGPVELIFN